MWTNRLDLVQIVHESHQPLYVFVLDDRCNSGSTRLLSMVSVENDFVAIISILIDSKPPSKAFSLHSLEPSTEPDTSTIQFVCLRSLFRLCFVDSWMRNVNGFVRSRVTGAHRRKNRHRFSKNLINFYEKWSTWAATDFVLFCWKTPLSSCLTRSSNCPKTHFFFYRKFN